ncbi:MAG: creatininase family protein [Alphaproteobacteria bacterium]
MPGQPRRLWQDMTTTEFAGLDPERVVAVLPVGAIEQHGPHLPVCVDAALNAAILDRAIAALPDDCPVTVLPPMPVGKSNEHLAYPGTLSLSAETLIRLWTEIGECVHRAGVRKLVLFNSHGGQPQIMDIVSRDLRVRKRMLVVLANWYQMVDPGQWFDADELRYGIHGGGIETSMMLHVRPDLVQMDRARDFASAPKAIHDGFRHMEPGDRLNFAWQSQDLNAAGAVGDAPDADADRGRALVEAAAAKLALLLREVVDLPLSVLRDGPLG